MDVHTPEQRSFNMSRIKGKNTKPEILVRKWLWVNGYRYRLHRGCLPGNPDIVLSGRKKVIFVHGCFWHRHACPYFKWPKSNEDFWRRKINATVMRDDENYKGLAALGWSHFVIWECEAKNPGSVQLWAKLRAFLDV
ncbi:MAG: DNA mismatch endonuclease Vsr [Nitrospirae bacterium]|nr:DNA mismatch endonuclease Vsr [Nitrospirota bacterium]